jgi:DNA-binding LacI/PurR family transcriptional regulator/DNA-binding transcriptional regulator YhcF (GntR family)
MNSVHSACEMVRSRLLAGEWGQGERLPSLAALSKSCGVSRTTMWKAVTLLKRESLLYARERGAIIAGKQGFPGAQPIETQAWQRVRGRLGQEILNGVYIESELPPINKLALRYGVAIETMKKGLSRLVREGILERTGRRYRKAQKNPASYQPVIALISKGNKRQGSFITDHRTLSLFESVERECQRLGYQSRSEGFDDHSSKGLMDFASGFKKVAGLKGCIVQLWASGDDVYLGRWHDLLQYLVSRKIPVIVIDQAGDLPFPDSLLRCANFRVLRISSIRAGEQVASALLRRGTRHISYVSPFFGYGWARNRYLGLQRYCRNYGGPQVTVGLFKLDEMVDHEDLEWQLLGLDIKEIYTLFREHYSAQELEDIRVRLERIQKKDPHNKTAGNLTTGMIRDFANYLKKVIGKNHDANTYETMLKTLSYLASNKAEELYLRPFFEKVLESGRPSTWVCANDNIALYALSFLKRSGIKVPDEVSVIGFDNCFEAYELQMSSYDFNMNGMIQKAMQVILDEKVLKSMAAMSEVEGYVVERRTTRK